ncbi:T9SS type A sorting domain-containing protein [Cryomorphaceae bacterium 1068]|nr:T9SS type A sorting domain-containing protein [Cryomorphaceae bacterium 1068]
MKKPLLVLAASVLFGSQLANAQSCADVCPAVGLSSSFEWIAGVDIGPLFNISGNNDGYQDFGDVSATFAAGTTYSYQVGVGYGDGPFSETFSAWMDFNQDGDFEDPGEEIFTDFGQFQVSGSFSVPSNAVNGKVKLRIAMGFAQANLCQNVPEGEIEDYCVNMVGGIDPPNPCDVSAPVTGLSSTINPNNVQLTWDPVPNSVGCRVQGGLFGSFNVNKNLIGNEVSSLTVPLANLSPGTYNWRVTCACELPPNLTLTPFSAEAFFTIEAGIEVLGSQTLSQEMSLSPNPAASNLNVAVTSESDAAEQIIVTDLLGRTVMQENVNVIEGMNNFNLDVSSLTTGTYILILRDGNQQMTSMRFIRE